MEISQTRSVWSRQKKCVRPGGTVDGIVLRLEQSRVAFNEKEETNRKELISSLHHQWIVFRHCQNEVASPQSFPPPRQLSCDLLVARRAGEIAFGHGALQIKYVQGVPAKSFVHRLQLRQRELI